MGTTRRMADFYAKEIVKEIAKADEQDIEMIDLAEYRVELIKSYESYVKALVSNGFKKSIISVIDDCIQYEINNENLSMLVGFNRHRLSYIKLCITDREVNTFDIKPIPFKEMFSIWESLLQNKL